MAGLRDTRSFFTKGTVADWEFILTLYVEALKLKAQQKNKKPEELIKLDNWFQDELPKLITSRKEKHLTHDEIVQTMKWKLARGKWRPRLTDLVRINTPLAVMQVSKKAFRKLPNLASAVNALSSLKGIGPATASAILAAGAPELAPYMADECLMAIPECQAIDYTVQEYLIYTEQIQTVVERLNIDDNSGLWTPHRVEKALWTYCIINEFSPSLLAEMRKIGTEKNTVDALAIPPQNGISDSQGDNTTSSDDQHSVDGVKSAKNTNDEKTDNGETDHNDNGDDKEKIAEDEVEKEANGPTSASNGQESVIPKVSNHVSMKEDEEPKKSIVDTDAEVVHPTKETVDDKKKVTIPPDSNDNTKCESDEKIGENQASKQVDDEPVPKKVDDEPASKKVDDEPASKQIDDEPASKKAKISD